MPIVILLIAVLLIVVGLNDRLTPNGNTGKANLTSLIGEDIVPTDGSVSFAIWVLAIAFVGFIGFVKQLKGISNGFLVLLFVGIFLSGKQGSSQGAGFFANLTSAFQGLSQGKDNSTATSKTATSTNPLSGLGNALSNAASKALGSAASNLFGGSSAASGSAPAASSGGDLFNV